MTMYISSPIDISVSGLRAEALRMQVISNNIANVNTTRTDAGGPYCRREVLLRAADDGLTGVEIDQVIEDMASKFKTIYQPGNPDADSEGFVRLPNVQLPVEMMGLVAAGRAYQANAAVLKKYQEMINFTIELLK